MAYVKRFQELFKQERNKVEGVAYHGSKTPVNRFTEKLITGGDLPGIHLTSDENAARMDGGPYVTKADVVLKNVVQTGDNYKMKRPDALFMINESPRAKETGRNSEFKTIDEIMKASSAYEGFKMIYSELYKGHNLEFVRNMSELGIDAVVKKDKGVKNYIVFNVKAITLAQGS